MNVAPQEVTSNSAIYIPQNDGYIELEVSTPVLIKEAVSNYHTYPITGKDSNGPIEC